MHSFIENYERFEKMQEFMINDIINSTIKAHANFLVAMGLFNYMEILGSFAYPEREAKICTKRFDFTF
jgi:hypothetical protein